MDDASPRKWSDLPMLVWGLNLWFIWAARQRIIKETELQFSSKRNQPDKEETDNEDKTGWIVCCFSFFFA